MQRIATSIDIAAPVERVWSLLMDFASYPQWNPFVRKIAGTGTPGDTLQVTIAPEGGREMSFQPKVLVRDSNREFRWRGKVLFAGVFDGEHSFQLAAPTPETCKFVHEEIFTGILASLIMRGSTKSGTQSGFEAMNRALKARAEGDA